MRGTGNQQLQPTTHAHVPKSFRFKALADLIQRDASALWKFLGLRFFFSALAPVVPGRRSGSILKCSFFLYGQKNHRVTIPFFGVAIFVG